MAGRGWIRRRARRALAFGSGLAAVAALTSAADEIAAQDYPLGVGVVQPRLDPDRPLYFYGPPSAGTDPALANPIDSVTFVAGDHFIGIGTAPPWFSPAGMKLDYDLLWMRAETLTRDWVEVEVNTMEPRPRMTPRTAWVARAAVDFHPWPDFLLRVHSVEATDAASNPLRHAPFDEADAVAGFGEQPLLPLALRGEWIQVESLDSTESDRTTGWLRWTRDGRMLVRFALLS